MSFPVKVLTYKLLFFRHCRSFFINFLFLEDKEFKKAINRYVNEEIKIMNQEKKDLEQFSPFKN